MPPRVPCKNEDVIHSAAHQKGFLIFAHCFHSNNISVCSYATGGFDNIRPMDERDLLLLESAITAIEEASSAVVREVERDRLRESSLARLSTVEAELNRSRLALEKIIREEAG